MIRLMIENAANLEARTNLIRLMTANKENPKARNAIKRKIVRKTRNKTRQNHRQAILIRPTTVTIDAKDEQTRRAIRERILLNYAQG